MNAPTKARKVAKLIKMRKQRAKKVRSGAISHMPIGRKRVSFKNPPKVGALIRKEGEDQVPIYAELEKPRGFCKQAGCSDLRQHGSSRCVNHKAV